MKPEMFGGAFGEARNPKKSPRNLFHATGFFLCYKIAKNAVDSDKHREVTEKVDHRGQSPPRSENG
jgi:hypothetical protein